MPFLGSDGTCEHCESGESHLCNHPVGVPPADRNLVALPDEISFVERAALGCRVMTSYHGLVDRAQVRPGEWVVVFGCGGIGLSAISIASTLGAQVIGMDVNPDNLELARRLGATKFR